LAIALQRFADGIDAGNKLHVAWTLSIPEEHLDIIAGQLQQALVAARNGA
jgi:hypothetical protein